MNKAFGLVLDFYEYYKGEKSKMILTVCPNPSIDCTVELQSLDIGKMNRIESKIITHSGKALNVAIGASRLGAEVTASGFMYTSDSAQFIHTLEKEGVSTDFVITEGRVRMNYKIIDKRSMMTEINDRGDAVPECKQRELIEKIGELSKRASVVVMSGSLPQGVSDDFYLKLKRVIPKEVKVIVDCEKEKLRHVISEGIYLIKPNLAEFEAMTERRYTTKGEMIEGAKKLTDMGAQHVLLSLGEEGAILTNGKTHFFCKSANVAVNSTVGAGDCMISAASVMIEKGASLEQILRSSVAAGTASITTPGTNLFYNDKYEEIYQRIFVEQMR